MHVPQLPASHENGGVRPARRAVSSSVSPGCSAVGPFLPSSWIVTAAASVVPAGAVCAPLEIGFVTTPPFLVCEFYPSENNILTIR